MFTLPLLILRREQDAYDYCRQWTTARFQHITENDFAIRLIGGNINLLGAEAYGGDGTYDNRTGLNIDSPSLFSPFFRFIFGTDSSFAHFNFKTACNLRRRSSCIIGCSTYTQLVFIFVP